MPNITENQLIIRGSSDFLKYFYEQNRVTEDDIKYRNQEYREISELSFQKLVPKVSSEKLFNLIKNKYNEEKIDYYHDFLDEYWGTKWDAMNVKVYKDKIEEGRLVYTFETAWNYPYKWLETIVEIFPEVEFDMEIIVSDEDDEYDEVYHILYKNKEKKELKRYTCRNSWIEDKGGKEEILNELFEKIGTQEHLDDLRKIIKENKEKNKEFYNYFNDSGIYDVISIWKEKNSEVKKYLEENLTYHRNHSYYYEPEFMNALIERLQLS